MNDKVKAGIVVAVVTVIGLGTITVMNNRSKSKPADKTASNSVNSDQAKPATSGVESTNQITYKGFAVVQKTIKVKKGTTVTWTNEDSAKHDVTPVTESADFKASELFGKGETHSVTFNTVGTYAYYCSPHPYMKGTIEVTE